MLYVVRLMFHLPGRKVTLVSVVSAIFPTPVFHFNGTDDAINGLPHKREDTESSMSTRKCLGALHAESLSQ